MSTTEEATQITVVIVDDHALLRQGTRQILEQAGGFSVLGEAGDCAEALELVRRHRPDIVLMDVRLPTASGIETTRQLVAESPDVRVLMVSAYDDVNYVQAALTSGAVGYLLKTAPIEDLVNAIRAASTGVVVLDPNLSSHLIRQPGQGKMNAGIDALTTREREVIVNVAQGLSNKDIAEKMGISPRTVEGHLNHIFEKVGAESRTALVRMAIDNHIIDQISY